MRVAPAGLFFHDAGDLYAQAALSAAPTHAHPVGVDGAAVLARAVALVVRAGPGEALPGAMFLEDLIGFARTHPLREKLLLARELIVKQAPLRRAAELLGWGVEADRSVPYAVYAFLKNPHSFADCLMGAVLYGGDCDTLGAMAGGISGACLGIEAIPAPWRARLENRALIEALAQRLLEARG
jgi:poly(ADP-ribose) glycohydrolase ARH3